MKTGKAAKKQAYHHGDLRRALLAASLRLLEQQGPEAVTLRSVARELGVSHAAPSHHFPTKAALLAAIASQGFEELTACLARAASQAPDGLSQLKATGVAYVEFAVSHPALFRLMFGRELASSADAALRDSGAGAYAVLVDAAAAALSERPQSRPADLGTVTIAAWSVVHGLAMLWLDERLGDVVPAHPAELAARVTDLVGRAL